VETVFAIFILLFVAVAALTDDLGTDTVALLGLFAYAALRTMPSINKISLAVGNLRTGASAIATVSEDLDRTVPTNNAPASAGAIRLEDRICVVDVGYRYPAHDDDVLSGVSVEIPRGQSIGLVGATGSGKSTLVDVILGLLAPSRGCVLVDGADIRDRTVEWQRSLGVVSQTVFLLDDSLRHNIAFGVPEGEIDDQRVAEAVGMAQLDDFVASLPEGLGTAVGERGVRLSGGQRQRVAIARALANRPRLILADEPTGELHSDDKARVIDLFRDIHREGRTMIMVTHDPEVAAAAARRIEIRDGRVKELR